MTKHIYQNIQEKDFNYIIQCMNKYTFMNFCSILRMLQIQGIFLETDTTNHDSGN